MQNSTESFYTHASITAQDLEPYEGLIFDMDGTIIDSLPAHRRAWLELGDIFGFTVNKQVIIDNTGTTPRNICIAVLEEAGQDPEQVDVVLPEKIRLGLKYCREIAGKLPAWDLVEEFKGKKQLGLGTGSTNEFIDIFREKFDLEDYFGTAIISSDDVENHKPHPETFLKVAQRMNVAPNKCIVFEDGKFGIQAALACGMDAYDVINHKLYKASDYQQDQDK